MKIIAIGGGEIGRPGTSIETTKIDKEIISLSGKKKPRVLFIPTASHDSGGYVKVVNRHFGKGLGCKVDTLLLWDKKLPKRKIEEKIMSADIIYVGGGNTLDMLKCWKKLGVDKMLKKAGEQGKILSGISAGAVCWFQWANSDSLKMTDPKADYIKIKCLNFIPLFISPHFDTEKDRRPSLKKMLKKSRGIAVAIDNCAALEIVDSSFKVIASKPKASAYLCYWKGQKYFVKTLKGVKKLSPLSSLLRLA